LAIQLAASGAVDLDSLVTGIYGLSEVEQAFAATHDPNTLKAVIAPSRS
jgi:L-iditol 2-dehydrogenase